MAALLIEAGLKFQSDTPFTPEQIRTLMKSTALAMENPGEGYNYVSGSGFIQTHKAIMTFANPTPYVESLILDTEGGISEGMVTFTVNGDFFTDDTQVKFRGEYSYPINPFAEISRDIIMGEDVATLEEFVVVGYGVQKASDITGAVSTIRTNEITNLPVTRIDQALSGKAAGVQVNETTGQPGESVKVRIRGVGTINNNDPLYIVDGVPTKDIAGILNPEDIESMTVLKDAASAAIYGARAGNGVVIITTKKGVSQKPLISYNGWVGVQTVGNITPMTNNDQYIKIYNEAAANDGRKPIPQDIYPQLADVINMSVAPEAILANEAGIPYSSIAISTDYDSWKEDEAPVTWE